MRNYGCRTQMQYQEMYFAELQLVQPSIVWTKVLFSSPFFFNLFNVTCSVLHYATSKMLCNKHDVTLSSLNLSLPSSEFEVPLISSMFSITVRTRGFSVFIAKTLADEAEESSSSSSDDDDDDDDDDDEVLEETKEEPENTTFGWSKMEGDDRGRPSGQAIPDLTENTLGSRMTCVTGIEILSWCQEVIFHSSSKKILFSLSSSLLNEILAALIRSSYDTNRVIRTFPSPLTLNRIWNTKYLGSFVTLDDDDDDSHIQP